MISTAAGQTKQAQQRPPLNNIALTSIVMVYLESISVEHRFLRTTKESNPAARQSSNPGGRRFQANCRSWLETTHVTRCDRGCAVTLVLRLYELFEMESIIDREIMVVLGEKRRHAVRLVRQYRELGVEVVVEKYTKTVDRRN